MLDYKPLFDVGEGEPIILLNGLIGNLSNWGRVAYEFTSSHRILIPRVPFYQMPISSSRLEDVLMYLEKFVEAHALDKVTIIGNSLGGHMALLYAWRYPSKVKKLVLASSSAMFDNFEKYSLFDGLDLDFNEPFGYHTIYNCRETAGDRSTLENSQRINGQSKLLNDDRLTLKFQHYTECSVLHHVYAPTLLIWGLNDALTPPEVALAFHDHLPNSKIIFLDHCGHVPMVDQPKLFNQHVREFLER